VVLVIIVSLQQSPAIPPSVRTFLPRSNKDVSSLKTLDPRPYIYFSKTERYELRTEERRLLITENQLLATNVSLT